jgi:TonB family protein
MKVTIKEPCLEDWDNMKITMHSRHCLKCDKHLVDFRTFSRAEIIAYLLSNPVGSVCGRMSSQQFDFHVDDYPALMEVLKQPRFQSKAFMILALVGASLFSSCEQESNVRGSVSKSHKTTIALHSKEQKKKNTKSKKDKVQKDILGTVKHGENLESDHIETVRVVYETMGIPMMEVVEPERPIYEMEVPKIADDGPVFFAEVDAEYPGGYAQMLKYIQERVEYPTLEKDNGIEGKVIVRFVVNTNGDLENFEIVKGVPDGKGLEQEAIRVIKNMPRWKTAKNDGHSVSQYMTIPINFTLQ